MAEEKLKILYLMQMLLEETDPAHPMNATQLCERMQSRYDQEHFHAGVTVTVSPQFFGWLAGIGKGIRISWPEDVREEYKQYLQGIVESL